MSPLSRLWEDGLFAPCHLPLKPLKPATGISTEKNQPHLKFEVGSGLQRVQKKRAFLGTIKSVLFSRKSARNGAIYSTFIS